MSSRGFQPSQINEPRVKRNVRSRIWRHRSTQSTAESPRWQATAEWHQLLRKPVRGTYFFEGYGVEFHSAKVHERWGYVDIRSLVMSIKELRLELWPAEIRIKRVRHL